MQKFLAQPQVSIILPSLKTTEFYATLQHLCSKKGKALSQNDLWIGALAQEYDDTLVTYDQDFQVLKEIFGSRLIILVKN